MTGQLVSDSAHPLVSCIMPTYNRRAFVAQAIRYFLRQDYPAKELIVVDDGTDPVGDLLPEGARYVRLDRRASVGSKRNLACESAAGTLIAHWDDDDWQAPYRLRVQVEALLSGDKEVCGVNRFLFYDQTTGRAFEYVYPETERFWLYGNSLCYRRSFWASNRFSDVDIGEDTRFVWNGPPGRLLAIAGARYHVSIIHGNNTSAKQTGGSYWWPCPVEEVERLMGEDLAFYRPGHRGAGLVVSRQRLPGRGFRLARASDLALTEYAAFNHGQSLPWMRRWEMPWALFEMRLGDTMAVLDCTINPVNFAERLARLYPHVLYCHWNPIQNGQFAPAFGVPDGGFDRVVCINTLEHLLREQRETLIADMARKLKPGGRLVLTSDQYFDSAWQQPAFLQAGVLRADRAEVFNGFNRTGPREWMEIGGRHGLRWEGDPELIEEPREGDAGLYLNQPPFPHACAAGCLTNGEATDPPARKVVLSLLTWNTRDVSLESLHAAIKEARMLRRLGHLPFLCVCDNGSTDGTAEALHEVDAAVEVPHRFLLNSRNLGNSVARNQIVDYARECEADYLMFIDGDIELVPFSSFAMLRYLESKGRRLGCIGADSAGQTPERGRNTNWLYSVEGCQTETTDLVAWTQYGMFRCAVFEDGVRFDESPPFDGPGWGFEDNDLAFQMAVKGYLNQRFFGMTYLHRAARSSIRIMRQNGIDAGALYNRRKQYVIGKWARVPQIDQGPLGQVRRVQMQV